MKNKILATTTVLAALMATSQSAHADACKKQFTLIEELAPDLRQKISTELTEMMKYMDIDWHTIVAGVNENGRICLRTKAEVQCQQIAGSSCYNGGGAAAVTKVQNNE